MMSEIVTFTRANKKSQPASAAAAEEEPTRDALLHAHRVVHKGGPVA